MKRELKKELKEMVGKTFEFYGYNCLDNYMTSRGFDSMFDVDGWKYLLDEGCWAFYDYEDDGTPRDLVSVYVKFATEQDELNARELIDEGYSPQCAEKINLIVTKVEF